MSFDPSKQEFGDQDSGKWTHLIDDIVAGTWFNPETQKRMSVPYEAIVFEESLEGREAELVQSLNLGSNFIVVSDAATFEALGKRVAKALKVLGSVKTIVLDHPHADLETAEKLRQQLKGNDGIVAVGSGTINDLCKYATHLDGRGYCVFATAASMNGYTSSTASMTLASGLKVSLPAQAPKGFFVDLTISADAPTYLTASGFADCMARSVAQVDWWMSHRLLGTDYWASPYIIQDEDEIELNKKAALLPEGNIDAIASLHRVLTLCGLGISFTGISHHGSMGEHQISHYIDCFAGDRHPGTLHGQQVGVACLTMARLQQQMLAADEAPQVSPTKFDLEDMSRRMGPKIAAECLIELKKKAFTEKSAEAFNSKITKLWPTLKKEIEPFIIPVEEMTRLLKAAGAPTTGEKLGLPVEFYQEAVRHNHEMRDRFSFLDIAANSGLLANFAKKEG
ncbi:MAG: sn-glycerol-1-phosphate dehydrogenase [Rhizobiaceae bacterium]